MSVHTRNTSKQYELLTLRFLYIIRLLAGAVLVKSVNLSIKTTTRRPNFILIARFLPSSIGNGKSMEQTVGKSQKRSENIDARYEV